jgi:hypothetical protein
MNSAISAAGLVFDIAGGVFIALSFVTKRPKEVVAEAADLWDGNPKRYLSLAEQSADAKLGAVMLAIGFTLQTVGALGWRPGWAPADVVVPMAAFIDVLALLLLHRVFRPWEVRRVIGTVIGATQESALKAKQEGKSFESEDEEWFADELNGWGKAWNRERRSGESNAEYGARLLSSHIWKTVRASAVLAQTGSTDTPEGDG